MTSKPPRPFQFSMRTLMLALIPFAVLFSLGRIGHWGEPIFGHIFMAVLAVTMLVYTFSLAWRDRGR